MATTQMECTLPPHGPANMASAFMTRYDYDYNHDPLSVGSGDSCANSGNEGDVNLGLSGDVRNRPIFAHGVDSSDRDDRSVYRVDYTAKDRTVEDMHRLAETVAGIRAPPATAANMGDPDNGTAYQRNWYRPCLSSHIVFADGRHPRTAYQDDYQRRCPAAGGAGHTPRDPVCYPGAAATIYNADLLNPHGLIQDDGADLAPKITSKESLLPRKPKTANEAWSPVFENLVDHRRTWNDCVPGDGTKGTYTCTSWAYGDASLAHPLQLPVSLTRSLDAHGVDVLAEPDKAGLLRRLAGKKALTERQRHDRTAGTPYETSDRTNPQFLSTSEQTTCAVRQRLEKEHYVTRTMYQSDFIDQGQLPELPGNHGGPADVLDTHVSSGATPGEMVAGQLSRTMRELALLRDGHGSLKKGEAAPASQVSTGVLNAMRTLEKYESIDKADPHKHKLRA